MAKTENELSKTEWSLMHICWEKGEAPARDIYDVTLGEKKRQYVTVKTMLERLVNKGYLTRRKIGPVWVYKPVVLQKHAVARAIDGFMETVMGNQLSPLLSHFSQKEKLSPEDLKQLKKLIRENEGE